jgi:multidrug efflux pump subunit AcrB
VSYTSLSGRDWKNIKIPGTDIYLWQVIKDIKLLPKIKYYSNEDGRLVLKIDAFKYPNISLGYVTKKIKAIVEKYPQVQLYYSADIKDMQSAMKGLVVALLIGLIMMFLVLVGNFGNLKYSVIAFSILPLLLIWTFWFLLVFDLPFSFPAQLGIFGLIWVGINNAILLLERYLQLKNSWLNKKQIIIHTIFSRLRPVFLTTLTTVLGLISLALKDELWWSLGVAFMWGLIFWTLITLVYIPAWLSILKD